MKIFIKTVLLTSFALILCGALNAQTKEPTVMIAQETADRCAACFIQSKAQTALIAAQDVSINALKAEINAAENLAAARLTIIELLRDENDVLRKSKCETTTLFFVYKRKRCF